MNQTTTQTINEFRSIYQQYTSLIERHSLTQSCIKCSEEAIAGSANTISGARTEFEKAIAGGNAETINEHAAKFKGALRTREGFVNIRDKAEAELREIDNTLRLLGADFQTARDILEKTILDDEEIVNEQ